MTLKGFSTSNKLLLFCTLAFVVHIAFSTGFSSMNRYVSHISDKEPLVVVTESGGSPEYAPESDFSIDNSVLEADKDLSFQADGEQASAGAKPEESAETKAVAALSGKARAGTKININTAGRYELERLPGVGEATSLKIIDFRNKNGAFKRIEDIMLVSGIGEKKFANMKEFLTIE